MLRLQSAVMEKRRLAQAAAISAAMALLSLLPYALAASSAPQPTEFAGFLLNPIDGFSYLAKMRQGAAGSWGFELPYAAEPGPPAFIFTFYLALGQFTRVVGWPPIVTYHAARVLAVFLMGIAGYEFFRQAIVEERPRWLAYGLFTLGSGLGWIAGPLGLRSSDLFIPESIGWTAGLANPHFPLAFALVAASASLALRTHIGLRQAGLGALLGLALGLVQPLAAISLLAGLGAWSLWVFWRPAEVAGGRRWPPASPVLAGLAVGAGPWLAYDVWLVASHPVLNAWNQQNQTPSPSPLAYLMGFGLILVFAVAGALRSNQTAKPSHRLMIAWVVTSALLLYAPFNLQRRLVLGMILPLAGLAGVGLDFWLQAGRWPRLGYLVLILSLPSNLLVTAAGIVQSAAGDPSLLFQPGERAAYDWLADNVAAGSVVLAGPRTGNRLPAYAPVRVLYGHPFETPEAQARRRMVEAFFSSQPASPAAAAGSLGADFLLIGPEEAELGLTADMVGSEPLFQVGSYNLFEASSP